MKSDEQKTLARRIATAAISPMSIADSPILQGSLSRLMGPSYTPEYAAKKNFSPRLFSANQYLFQTSRKRDGFNWCSRRNTGKRALHWVSLSSRISLPFKPAHDDELRAS